MQIWITSYLLYLYNAPSVNTNAHKIVRTRRLLCVLNSLYYCLKTVERLHFECQSAFFKEDSNANVVTQLANCNAVLIIKKTAMPTS